MTDRRLFPFACALALLGCPAEPSSAPSPAPTAPPPAAPTAAPAPAGPPGVDVAALRKWAARQFGTLPAQADNPKNPITPEKVALGRQLYFDARLSKNHDISCATCHDLDKFGIDPRPDNAVSLGHKGQKGTRNSPTVYNAALQTAQFWDSREPDVESQAKGPMINPVEMAMPEHTPVVAVVKSIPGYVESFKQAFPEAAADPITIDTIAQAIGAFERKLITPAPFDRWLAGDDAAMTADQVQGLSVYKEVNCLMCHAGNLLGGNMQQKLGLQEAWEGNPDDGKMFKVPTLRNVEKTGPWLHDGSMTDLGLVVSKMAKHQLGKELTPEQTKSLVAFLGALTGEPPAELIKKPELPPSGPDTPKPDPN